MDVVENTPEVALDAFLERLLFCFLAQTSEEGPRVSPLWFLWEDGAVWIIAQLDGRSYPDRVGHDPRTALVIVDFEPATGRVEHVGMRGRAALKAYDTERAERLWRSTSGSPERRGPSGSSGCHRRSSDSSGSTRRRSSPATSPTPLPRGSSGHRSVEEGGHSAIDGRARTGPTNG